MATDAKIITTRNSTPLDDSYDGSMAASFIVEAPGRICLFGEHSDYLGFPVIARAVPLYCRLEVQVKTVRTNDNNNDVFIYLHVPEELGKSKRYDMRNLPPSPPSISAYGASEAIDFALAAIHEVLKEGWDFHHIFSANNNEVMEVHCYSSSGELPLQAGCSSSTAFLVAWVLMLAKLSGKAEELQRDRIRLAQLAHRAEVTHFGHPGGTMDHVSIALGTAGTILCDDDDRHNYKKDCGALRIGPEKWQIEPLPVLNIDECGVWILADSGEPKDTLKHLKRCKHDRLQLLQDKLHGNWDCSTVNSDYVSLSELEQRLWHATLINRDTELKAANLWKEQSSSSLFVSSDNFSTGQYMALLMKRHHEALRDGLGLSTPRLEALNNAALASGAWGFKVVGSGGGGCGVAWAPTDKAETVSRAMKDAGAKATWFCDSQQPVQGLGSVD
jgi:galactokinase